MFDKDFFPTPINLIKEILKGVDIEGKVFLEPSAGKGNIVDYLYDNKAKDVLACEKHEELRKILSTKCRIVSNDFLDLTSDKISHIDVIVMNPPFSADEKHLLHAYYIAPNGTEIIALINYNTYSNQYTSKRKELGAIIDSIGSIQELGSVFSNAERTTDVNVGLVRIKKPGQKPKDEFEGFFMDDEPEEQTGEGIMSYNFIRDMVNRYVSAVKLFEEQTNLGLKMNELTGAFSRSKISFSCKKGEEDMLKEDYKKELQKEAWKHIFHKLDLDKWTTSGLESDINKFVETQSEIPFTMKNIYKMLEIVIGTTKSRMDRAIVEVFDKLTKHYHDNRYFVEGWKTNSHYLVNKKFIINGGLARKHWLNGSFHVENYQCHTYDQIQDLVKALCYLSGVNYNKLPSLDKIVNNRYKLKYSNGDHVLKNYHCQSNDITYVKSEQNDLIKKGVVNTEIHDEPVDFGKWFDWTFFRAKGFKKGTMHFEFKDDAIWELFNRSVAKIKGYPLPEKI